MAQEIELSDYTTIHDFRRTETNSGDTQQSGAATTKRRLLRFGILTLGMLCIIQATLNISLRLASYSKEDTDQFPFNISVIADACQIDQSQQNSIQLCSCCNKVLRKLLREYQAMERERDILRNMISQLTKDITYDTESGSGSLDEYYEY